MRRTLPIRGPCRPMEPKIELKATDLQSLFLPASSRVVGYDLARALAILGMVVINYSSMMEVVDFSPPWLKPVVDFIYGRAAVVFVMLAGVSVTLMAARDPSPPAMRALRKRLVKRSLLLLIAGMILWRWWDADILHFYAVFIAAGSWAAGWGEAKLREWTVAVLALSLPVCATLTSAYDLGHSFALEHGHGIVPRLLLDFAISPYYAVLPWLGFFLVGMLLGRREPAPASFWRRACLIGALICLAVEIFSGLSMAWGMRRGWEFEGNWWIAFLRSEAFPVTPLFILSAGAGGLALISLCRMTDQGSHQSVSGIRGLAAFGRLSLSMYVAHIGWGLFFKHWMKGPCGGVDSNAMFLAAGIFDLAGLAFAVKWCRHYRRGPLETFFHRLTCGRIVPPRQAQVAACPVTPE